MKKIIVLLGIIGLALATLVLAHGNELKIEYADATPTNMVTVSFHHGEEPEVKKQRVVNVMLRFDDQTRNGLPRDPRNASRQNQQKCFTGKGFEPDTFVVREGDHVRLFIESQHNIDFNIPSLGINRILNHGVVEFDVEEEGVYEYMCLGCDPHIRGVFYVK